VDGQVRISPALYFLSEPSSIEFFMPVIDMGAGRIGKDETRDTRSFLLSDERQVFFRNSEESSMNCHRIQ
jgi:hypothetical protein